MLQIAYPAFAVMIAEQTVVVDDGILGVVDPFIRIHRLDVRIDFHVVQRLDAVFAFQSFGRSSAGWFFVVLFHGLVLVQRLYTVASEGLFFVLLGHQVIVVLILGAKVLLAYLAAQGFMENLLVYFATIGYDLLLEVLNRDRGQFGYFSFEVVAVPVGLVVLSLYLQVAEGNTTGYTGVCRHFLDHSVAYHLEVRNFIEYKIGIVLLYNCNRKLDGLLHFLEHPGSNLKKFSHESLRFDLLFTCNIVTNVSYTKSSNKYQCYENQNVTKKLCDRKYNSLK